MAVPDFQSLMRPTLAVLQGNETLTARELRQRVAEMLNLSDADVAELLPSGKQSLLANRVGWSVTYLGKAGAVERPARGRVRITERGRQLLSEHPNGIGIKTLDKFPEFHEFRASKRERPSPSAKSDDESTLTPTERIQLVIDDIDGEVEKELLQRVYAAGDVFLETLSVRLLQEMGYGGREGRSLHTGAPGDKGIDGIIRQDALGIDLVGVQAKCYGLDRTVTRPDIQAFAGALQGAQTQRGVFVTTARFSQGAIEFAEAVALRLVLIDGPTLARYLRQYGLGVTTRQTYQVTEVDEDFFDE